MLAVAVQPFGKSNSVVCVRLIIDENVDTVNEEEENPDDNSEEDTQNTGFYCVN